MPVLFSTASDNSLSCNAYVSTVPPEYHNIVPVTAGMQQVTQRSGRKAQVASVLLLTDGQANVGPSTQESILDAMRNHMSYNCMQSRQPMAHRTGRMNPFAVSMAVIAMT